MNKIKKNNNNTFLFNSLLLYLGKIIQVYDFSFACITIILVPTVTS